MDPVILTAGFSRVTCITVSILLTIDRPVTLLVLSCLSLMTLLLDIFIDACTSDIFGFNFIPGWWECVGEGRGEGVAYVQYYTCACLVSTLMM